MNHLWLYFVGKNKNRFHFYIVSQNRIIVCWVISSLVRTELMYLLLLNWMKKRRNEHNELKKKMAHSNILKIKENQQLYYQHIMHERDVTSLKWLRKIFPRLNGIQLNPLTEKSIIVIGCWQRVNNLRRDTRREGIISCNHQPLSHGFFSQNKRGVYTIRIIHEIQVIWEISEGRDSKRYLLTPLSFYLSLSKKTRSYIGRWLILIHVMQVRIERWVSKLLSANGICGLYIQPHCYITNGYIW